MYRDGNDTLGQSSHEHSKGRVDCKPAEASCSETVPFAMVKSSAAWVECVVVRDTGRVGVMLLLFACLLCK